MKEHFCPVGAYKQWLLQDRIAPWGGFINRKSKDTFERILTLHGGFNGPLKSYKSLMRDVNAADEAGKYNAVATS